MIMIIINAITYPQLPHPGCLRAAMRSLLREGGFPVKIDAILAEAWFAGWTHPDGHCCISVSQQKQGNQN